MFTKKVLAVILALVMVVGSMSVTALADDPVEGEEKYVAYIPVEGEETLKFTSLAAALEAVEGLTDITIYLADNDELTDNMIIPEGIIVVIATSANYEADNTTKGNNVSGRENPGDAFATLTIPNEFTLTVNGTLIVAGNQQGSNPHTGFLTGNYGAVDVEGNMIVNGDLYARGEVYTNTEGKVIVNSTARVFQRFEIADWRGGTGASFAYSIYQVFPFNLYGLGGISADTTYYSGAELYGQAYIYASNQNVNVNVPFLITEGEGLIRFTDNEGTVQFSKNDEGTTTVTVNAKVETGHLSFKEDVDGETYPITSDGTVCPIGYNLDFVFTGESTATILTELKVMPGCDITFKDNSKLIIGGFDAEGKPVAAAAYFYTAADYSDTYNWAKWPTANENVGDAVLEAPAGAVELIADGKIGSTSADLLNLPDSFTPVEGEAGTAQITEFIQGSPIYLSSTKDVTFHLANPAA